MAAQDDLTLNVTNNHRRKWDEMVRLIEGGPVEVALVGSGVGSPATRSWCPNCSTTSRTVHTHIERLPVAFNPTTVEVVAVTELLG